MKLGRVKKISPKRAKVNKTSPKRASPKPAKKVNKISPKRVKKVSPKRVKKVSPSPVKKVNKVFRPKTIRRVPKFPICLKFRVEWYDESTNSYDGHVNTSLLKDEVKQAFVNAIQNTFINSIKYVYFGPSETISDINITFEPSSYIKMTGSLPYNPNIKRYEMTFGDSVKAINRKNIDQYEYSGSWAVFDGERYYKLDSVEVC
jgi:hypothetical protein